MSTRPSPRRESTTEVYSYRGHAIDLRLRELRAGSYQSTFFIDASYCFEASIQANALDVARRDAIARAHSSIDALDPIEDRAVVPVALKAATLAAGFKRATVKGSGSASP